jgi:hypothetical protein
MHARIREEAEGENEAAVTLADRGYTTHQNPTKAQVADARARTGDTGDPEKDPDFPLEGRVWDCYSPGATEAVRGIWSEARDKVIKKHQLIHCAPRPDLAELL